MMDFAIKLVITIPIAAIGALFVAFWRQRHPYRPGRVSRWLYARAERKLAAMPGLTPAVREERAARLRQELHTPPYPQRSFGEEFRHGLLVTMALFLAVALVHVFLDTLKS